MKNTIEYKGYTGSVQFIEKDKILYGKILGIKDLISYEGSSVDEFLSDFHEAVDGYLEFCERKGQTPEKPFKGMFNVRVSPETHKQLALLAADRNQTLNSLVEEALTRFLAGNHSEAEAS